MNPCDHYLVFRCINTRELAFAARGEGLPVWAAIRTTVRMRGAVPRPVVVKECVIPGYVFVRGDGVPAFRRWCPSKYAIQVLSMPTAQPGSKGLDWEESRAPVQLPAGRLERFFAHLKSTLGPAEAVDETPDIRYKVGELVDVVDHPLLPDMFGCVVERGRADGTLRLRIPSGKILNLHKSCVQHKNRG